MRQPPPLLCALLVLLSSCGSEEAAPAEGSGSGGGGPGAFTFPVTFVPLARGDVEERVELVGDVESLHRAELGFERAGRIVEILRDAGDEVREGEVLARLDASVVVAELVAARAAARAARADAGYATSELARAQKLGDALAESERDRWTSEVAMREARAAQSEAEILRLEALEAQCTLKAPFAGTLVARSMTVGSHAQAGASVLELVDTLHLEIRLEVPAALAADLGAGETVRLSVGGAEFVEKLAVLLPSADPGTRSFRALIRPAAESAAAAGLRPGAFVRAQLVVRRASGALLVPRDALMESPQGAAVMVADLAEGGGPPIARLVPVLVIARDSDQAAVRPLVGELAEGIAVLVTGNDNVFPGAPLRLQEHRAITAQ